MGLFGSIGKGLSSAIQAVGGAGKSVAGAARDVADKGIDVVHGLPGAKILGGLPGMVGGLTDKIPGMDKVNELKSKLPGGDMLKGLERANPNDLASDQLHKLNQIAAMHQAASMTPGEGQDPTRPRIPNPFRQA